MDLYRFDRQGNLEVRRGVHAVDSPAYFRDGWSQSVPETPVIDVAVVPDVAPTPAMSAPVTASPVDDSSSESLTLLLQVEPETPKRRTRKPALEG